MQQNDILRANYQDNGLPYPYVLIFVPFEDNKFAGEVLEFKDLHNDVKRTNTEKNL